MVDVQASRSGIMSGQGCGQGKEGQGQGAFHGGPRLEWPAEPVDWSPAVQDARCDKVEKGVTTAEAGAKASFLGDTVRQRRGSASCRRGQATGGALEGRSGTAATS